MRQTVAAAQSHDGRVIDDNAFFRLLHIRHDAARDVHRPFEVDIDHRVPFFVRHAVDGRVGADAGVIEQDIDLAFLALDRLEQAVEVVKIGDTSVTTFASLSPIEGNGTTVDALYVTYEYSGADSTLTLSGAFTDSGTALADLTTNQKDAAGFTVNGSELTIGASTYAFSAKSYSDVTSSFAQSYLPKQNHLPT